MLDPADCFDSIPTAVIAYVRTIFTKANLEVSRTLTLQPFMHEEGLDHIFVTSVSAAAPRHFSDTGTSVAIETHWLGGRAMFGRWEIADIALFVTLRRRGKLLARKVALLQSKRLYADEISNPEMEAVDFQIGIGRLVDIEEQSFPLSHQRKFHFSEKSKFLELKAESSQVGRIKQYASDQGIPVYYSLYQPMEVPYVLNYPALAGHSPKKNKIGCRVFSSDAIHHALASLQKGKSPTFSDLTLKQPNWRVERFVADEVLRCREGAAFENSQDQRLTRLLYFRSAPITAAIAISIDMKD